MFSSMVYLQWLVSNYVSFFYKWNLNCLFVNILQNLQFIIKTLWNNILRNIRLTKNGIECANSTSTVYLDPKKIQNEGVHFVSHAHIDHLPNGGDGTILCSTETNKIAELRGFALKNSISTLENFTLVDSGHIFVPRGFSLMIFFTLEISPHEIVVF